MRILNLYAGLGGNRKFWGSEHEVTAVEKEKPIADAYKDFFPEDYVVVGDAHDYLLKHFHEHDIIWSSPPCPSHGQYRFNVGVRAKGFAPLFPDMKLYEEIIFLKHHFAGLWAVENVRPYYEPLIAPTARLQRHLFWSNFNIPSIQIPASNIRSKNKFTDYDLAQFPIGDSRIGNKRQALRNCVEPSIGLHVLNSALESA